MHRDVSVLSFSLRLERFALRRFLRCQSSVPSSWRCCQTSGREELCEDVPERSTHYAHSHIAIECGPFAYFAWTCFIKPTRLRRGTSGDRHPRSLGKRETVHPTSHCHHQNDFGVFAFRWAAVQVTSMFHQLLEGKVAICVHESQFLKREESRNRSNRGPAV